jgi:hypothetical protein
VRRPWAFADMFRRRRKHGAAVDPRAEELRLKLAESRDAAEPEPAPEGPESRRRAVHEAARATAEQMRKS